MIGEPKEILPRPSMTSHESFLGGPMIGEPKEMLWTARDWRRANDWGSFGCGTPHSLS